MKKEALVLCGGYGRRLGELTVHQAKSLVSLAEKPILSHSLYLLKEELSPKRFVLLTAYYGEQVKKHFGGGESFGTRIDYVDGEIGEVGNDSSLTRNIIKANKIMTGPWYWTCSGDYIFSRNFLRFVARQPRPLKNEVAHLYFKKRINGKHNIILDGDRLVEIGRGINGQVAGSRTFYTFSKEAVAKVNPEGLSSVNDFLNELTRVGKVKVILHDYWLMDIDTPGDLKEAELWLLEHPNY